MAKKRTTLFAKFVTLLTIAVVIVSFIYFFMPELSERLFTISWDTTNYTMSKAEQEERLNELLYNIKNSYERSGATADEIEYVLNQISKEDLIEASSQAIKSGANAVEAFVDTLEGTVDFGELDTNILKNQLHTVMTDVDFEDAMSIIRQYLQSGFDGLETVLKDLVSQ